MSQGDLTVTKHFVPESVSDGKRATELALLKAGVVLTPELRAELEDSLGNILDLTGHPESTRSEDIERLIRLALTGEG
jgi:hypothetical protein